MASDRPSEEMVDFDFATMPQITSVDSINFSEKKIPANNAKKEHYGSSSVMNASYDQMDFMKKRDNKDDKDSRLFEPNSNAGVNLVTNTSEGAHNRLNGSMNGINKLLDRLGDQLDLE